MEKYILPFTQISKDDIAIAGGKGANLGEMTKAGIPVPPGVVLTAAAYDQYIESNGIETGKDIPAKQIRESIINGKLTSQIKKEIISYYKRIGEESRVAVRSSATAEDLDDASFAGQQETYLNVVGLENLLESIKRCYASLWGDRAVSYRRTHGYGGANVSLAVVIQQMIESDTSGVMFTRNPADGQDEVLVNASYGLGEAVVSGMVSPDEYVCSSSGELKEKRIGSKEVQIVYWESGTCETEVPRNLRSSQTLDEAQIRQLVLLGKRIESHYGHPMDIEWAIKNNEIYILQARSITTIGQSKTFTEKDFADLPGIKPAKGRLRENILFNLEKVPNPYYPLDHGFGDYVGKQKQILLHDFGIDMDEMCPVDGNGITSFSLGGFRLNRNIFKLPKTIHQMKDFQTNSRLAAQKLECGKRQLENERQTEHSTILDVGLALERMHKLVGDTAYARFRYAIFPQVLMNNGLKKTMAKADRNLDPFDLMNGLSYVTADLNRDMDEIAKYIISKDDEELSKDVISMSYYGLVEKYSDIKEMFEDFMLKYGNKLDFNCYCFMSKSWNEDPERFLGTLRTMLRSADSRVLTTEESDSEFKSLMNRIAYGIGDRKYKRFKAKVEAVRTFHQVREASQYLWESTFTYCRELLTEASALLDVRYEDLLYLFDDEFFEVCRRGYLDQSDIELIEGRKSKRPLAEAYWRYSIAKMLDTGKEEVCGVAGSPGKATGKVCVVDGPSEFWKLQQGEILVCKYTDPEWTPLFTLAAGVVVDTGGTLSHAAIVAREYGIPAIMATGNATSVLKDGEMVFVDGDKGTVSLA